MLLLRYICIRRWCITEVPCAQACFLFFLTEIQGTDFSFLFFSFFFVFRKKDTMMMMSDFDYIRKKAIGRRYERACAVLLVVSR